MSQIKLVACDLDGTLLNEKGALSDKTIKTVKKLINKEIKFSIASGRNKAYVFNFVRELGSNVFSICNNGSNIYDNKQKSLINLSIERETIKEIINFFDKNKINYNGFDEDRTYIQSKTSPVFDSSDKITFNIIVIDELEDYPPLMKLLVMDEPNRILELKEKILKENFASKVDITMSNANCLDIVTKNSTKGLGLTLLAEKLNISLDEIMAFGDAGNDVHMLETVGHPVIMDNALSYLKEKFDNIALSNDKDGVATYLEKFFKL